MKSSKTNDINMKDMCNVIIISLLLLTSIYIIYFLYDDPNDISNNLDSKKLQENFGKSYKNICESTKTQFYDLTGAAQNFSIPSDISDCREKCNDISECVLYTISGEVNDGTCNIYTKNNLNYEISYNCSSNIIPSNEGLIYNGYGYVNSNYFKDYKSEFKHKNYLLKKAEEVTGHFDDINSKIQQIHNKYTILWTPGKTEQEKRTISGEILTLRDGLNSDYDNLSMASNDVGDYLDLEQNKIYGGELVHSVPNISDVRHPYSSDDTSGGVYHLGDKTDLSYNKMINHLNRRFIHSNRLNTKIEDTSKQFTRDNIVYTIILVLFAISAILLALYKFIPNLISNTIILIYFLIVISILLFMHYFFKI